MIEQTVEELTPIVGTRPACRALGAAPATIYRRRRPPTPPPARPRSTPARALSEREREAVLAELHSERFVDCSPAQVWATLLDEGRYLASERTMYRLLAARHGRVRERRDQLTHPPYARPELLACRPNELWSWDISKLKGPAKWTCFYLYVILDVFSRYCVGWTVQHRESAELAKALIGQACEQQRIGRDQLTVHADRGSAMRSKPVAFLLADLGVPKTHSRPYTSTDNPLQRGALQDAQVPAPVPRAVRLDPGGARVLPVVLRLVQPPALPLRDRPHDPPLARLIDELWGESPPAGAVKTARVYVSRLRKLLPGRIKTSAAGYSLQIDDDELDLRLFERLRDHASGGRAEEVARLLREALLLFRGQPLADFVYASWAQNEISRLDELRLVTLEDRIEADLVLGRHAELVSELQPLVETYPLRERLRGQLMLALYRSGRQAEALECYRQARQTLVEKLGIDLSPALQTLERAILNQAVELAPPSQEPGRLRLVDLPTPLTRVVGRRRELTELTELIGHPGVRLVTLTGPGGSGKTRLALELASTLGNKFADGVVFCPLASVRDPLLVVPTVARQLGLREQTGRPFSDVLPDFLANRELLIVLDNFEQVVEAAVSVAGLLATAPRLKLIVTSRAALRIAGEQLYPVPPLALPDPQATDVDPDQLAAVDAVAMFIQRSQAVRPAFRLTSDNAAAVCEICLRLDGLPLALELAAARLAILSPAALAERLGERLTLLTDGKRDADERHRTLRDTIAWSYELLAQPQRALFEQLAIFVGGFTLDAAENVCTVEHVLGGLATLVEKSLLLERELDGAPRFFLLETIREYAAERLRQTPSGDGLARRHAEYFAALAERTANSMRREIAASMRLLDAEYANLAQALAWASQHDQLGLELRLAGSLRIYWAESGRLSEGRQWLEAALAHGSEQQDEAWANVVRGAANVAYYQGDLARATELHEQDLTLRRKLGDRRELATALGNLGLDAQEAGDWAKSRALYQESITLARELGDKQTLGLSLGNLSLLAFLEGNFAEAAQLADESIAISREAGDTRTTAVAYSNLASALAQQHQYEQAREALAHCLQLIEMIGLRRLLLGALAAGAAIAADEHEFERAARLLGAIDRLAQELGTPPTHSESGDHDRANRATRQALGAETFLAAHTQGRQLTVQAAIRQALDRP